MNRSDQSIVPMLAEFCLTAQDLIVVHDDLDLEPGRLRIRPHGGSGGHRGVAALINALGTDEFARVRVGIGRPPAGIDPIDHVLAGFTDAEAVLVGGAISRAANAIATMLDEGLEAAMNRHN
jgi:PTH1 family peptidyl-tRNA hydrolase